VKNHETDISIIQKEEKIILEDVPAPLCKDKGVLIQWLYFVIFKIIGSTCGSSSCVQYTL